jgi:drug/metabolite transporter (DMT)-like permease
MSVRHPHALRGIGLMMLAASTFACLDATSKYLTTLYPVPAIVWARYVFQVLLMVAVLGPRLGMGLVRTTNLRLQILRGLVLTGSSLVFLTALSFMPLAEAASIGFMAPLMIAVLSGPVLHERVESRTWLALAAGFGGMLLIIRPGGGLLTWVALLPLLTALLTAIYQLMTRKLAGRDAALTTLLYPALIGTMVVPLIFPLSLALPRQPLHAALFVAVGVLGGIGHYLLIKAHDYAPPSVLGPFMYAQLVTALVLGWLIFGQLPDGVALIGMLTITASGLLLILSHMR